MKRLLLRVTVLAAVSLLGWGVVTYAQHQSEASDSPLAEAGDLADTTAAGQSQPTVPVEVTQLNPLRGSSDAAASSEPFPAGYPAEQPGAPANAGAYPPSPAMPSDAVRSNEPSAAGAPPDPFGLQSAGSPPNAGEPPATGMQPLSGVQPSAGYDDRAGHADTGSYPVQNNTAAPNQFQGEPSGTPLSDYRGASYGSDSSGATARFPSNPSANSNSYPPSDTAAPVAAAPGDEGTGRPAGDRRLDGQQTPQLSIQKTAPEEIQVGKPAVFRVEVKNTGSVAAQNVEIRDQIPEGTRLIDTKPSASRGERGELVWNLGKIEPGGGESVEMQVMPTAEGEIGSVATVVFSASASMRTRATKPQLALNVAAPQTIMIEGQMTLSITVSNPGSGVATHVVLEEHVPPCLQHPAGAELEYEVGDLAPNESKSIELQLTAVRPGQAANLLIARADAVEPVKKQLPIEVVAPQLKIEMAGPRNRYLERQATYEVAVSNPGTAPARDVRIVAELPSGLKFVSANNNGHYDPQTRTVQWALAELPIGETAPVQLTTLPVEIGRHAVQLSSTAEKALTVKEEEQILVDGIAAIRFEVVDVQDPIEGGGETVYEVRVLNQGSKETTQMCLAAELAPGLAGVAAEGPDSLGSRVQGNYLIFDPLPKLSPKVDVTYRIRVKGRAPGDQRIRVQLTAAELQSPVTKEESTRVFSDR